MGVRSKVAGLPEGIRRELFQRAADGGLTDYAALVAWLAAAGHAISKSSVHRALAPLETDLALLRRAQFIQAASGRALELSVAIQAIALSDLASVLLRKKRAR
jgi:hypothetical protein